MLDNKYTSGAHLRKDRRHTATTHYLPQTLVATQPQTLTCEMTATRMFSALAFAANAARTGSTKLSGPVTGHAMGTVSVRTPCRDPSQV